MSTLSETHREELAEVLAEHVSEQSWKPGGWAGDTACSCGWRMAMWSRRDFPETHRKHIADALAPVIARWLDDAHRSATNDAYPLAVAAHQEGYERGRAEALRGVKFRVETACDGYEALTEADVPTDAVSAEDFIDGAAEAAREIRAALNYDHEETP